MNRRVRLSNLGLFFLIPAILLLSGCVKDNRDVVPYAYLNVRLGIFTDLSQLGVAQSATVIPDQNGNLSIRFGNPQLIDIQLGPGNIVNGNGLIIYRSDAQTYEVYDITCTYQAQSEYCRLDRHPDFEGIYQCPCCDSRFIYGDGVFYPLEPPAALPLKRYPVFIDNQTLVIRN